MTNMTPEESLCIVWSSDNPEVAHNLAFMYGHNSLREAWWERVRILIWGPSARLAAEDETIQGKIREMMADGVEIWACLACADNYNVADQLKNLGINVLYVGAPFTQMIKSGWKVLTF